MAKVAASALIAAICLLVVSVTADKPNIMFILVVTGANSFPSAR